MATPARFFKSLLVSTFVLGGLVVNPAMAEEKAKAAKQATQKTLEENDKVKVYEARFAPGAEGASTARPMRVIRVLKGGTLMRIYPDGKTENVPWKTGQVKIVGPDPEFKPKNVGKTEIVLYVVQLK